MRITALSGGIGGARFLRGLLPLLGPGDQVSVIGNTADDIELFGLTICPDLDTLMYTLGGGIDEQRGWGRAEETWHAKAELAAYGAHPQWFGLGDRDLATHVIRTQMLRAGFSLSDVTAALCTRWNPGVRLLPMSDDRVETHVVVASDDGSRRAIHFQEYWVRLHAEVPVLDVVVVGAAEAAPAPGVLAALADADLVLLPPSNPVVSIGTILAVPGIAAAIRTTPAPVVGISPIIAGAAVSGMADQLLAGLDIEGTAAGVALHYGARSAGGILDGWLVHTSDAPDVERLAQQGIRAQAVPLLMSDLPAASAMAQAALRLSGRVPA
ncbi:MAG: 2-phospho-L-lactate transferase [Actinomycetota bacterium]|nr:2-phospho-L-lactate transferase [Actinomycetota bacterium]